MRNHAALSPSAMINWLAMAKFSDATPDQMLNAIFIPPPDEKYVDALDYVLALSDLSHDVLRDIFDAELQRVAQEAQTVSEAHESALFFNAPSAFADHLFWVRSLFWTAEQAVALSLNRNPVVVNTLNLAAHHASETAFATEYGARLYLVNQSVRFGRLTETISPDAFIKWLNGMGLHYPIEMEEAAVALNYRLTDWEAEYRALMVEYNALELETETAISKLQSVEREYGVHIIEQAQTIRSQAEEIETMKAEFGALKTENDTAETEKPNKSLQKMALGMAMKSFHYDPHGKRNSAVTNIVSAVVAAGLSISDDTVREQLKAAAALFLPNPKSDSQAPK